MAFVVADRVKETSTSTSTTPFALDGAMTGFKTFASKCAVGDTLYYAIQGVDGTGTPTAEWECGLGTYSAASTLTRTTVTASSNADAAVNFSAGTKQVYITMPAVQVAWARERLTAARTYYVRTDGNDSNTGLANTAGGAFLTIQKAIDVITSSLDTAIYDVTIQIADGTYTAALTGKAITGAGSIILKGNLTTPANVHLNVTSGTVLTCTGANCRYIVRDLKMSAAAGSGVFASNGAYVIAGNLNFGAISTIGLYALDNGLIVVESSYAISGGGSRHWGSAWGGKVQIVSVITITVTGTPAFSLAFAQAITTGAIYAANITFSGTATGVRYDVATNAVLYSGGLTFPGSVAGAAATGGQYV